VTVRVKLCGVTRLEDALLAADLGLDAVGFNFVAGSPRRIAPERARAIGEALPPFLIRVGVFAGEPTEAVQATALLAGIQCAQLHGDESPEVCARLTIPWYKAHRVTPEFRLEDVARWPARTFLLDGHAPGVLGGSGRPFDWSVARRAAAYGRVILAGGLQPDTVAHAIAIARPYAVDVNSGVESAPGRKEPRLLAEFMRRVRQAAAAEDPDGGAPPAAGQEAAGEGLA